MMTEIESPEMEIPELDGDSLYQCVNELNSRFQKLIVTGQSINDRYPGVIAELSTPQERAGVVAIAARVKARLAVVNQRRKDIELT